MTTNLLDRIEAANLAGSEASPESLAAAAEWWIKMHGEDTIDLGVDGKIAAYNTPEGSTLYVWLGAESGEWHVMVDYAQAETMLFCPVSSSDEEAIEMALDEFGVDSNAPA